MQVKGILKIVKLIFYLFLYLHCVACFWNYSTIQHGPTAYFVQRDGSYKNMHGTVLNNEDGIAITF
jgi:hypothetical protein